MRLERGILIHPEELSADWCARVCASSLSRFGLHPPGGEHADRTMAALIADLPALTPRLNGIAAHGITIEHEMHALRWMLPASLFPAHPAWFRMNERGERVPDFNLCPSNGDALAYVSGRAAEAARLLPAASHRYHFWIDDVKTARCHCPDCRRLSASDQAMRICNAILAGLRRTDPQARQCYLAYHNTLDAPRAAEPEDGIYLEYAPMGRDFDRPLDDVASEKNRAETAPLGELLACFGTRDAMACEYWLDNSMYSGWKKPPKPFHWNREVTMRDLDFYDRLGFAAATTFACYLGEDYEAENGPLPDLSGYLML